MIHLDETSRPKRADLYTLTIGYTSETGMFHVYDLAGYVCSTQDPTELAEWLCYQQVHGNTPVGYGALRERFFPGTYEQKLVDLVSQSSARSTPIRLAKSARVRSIAAVTITDGDALLKELGL